MSANMKTLADAPSVLNFNDKAMWLTGWNEAAAELERRAKEIEGLKAFAQGILKDWPDCMVDGGDIQDLAVKHGLLVGKMVTEACQEEGCNCSDYGFPSECFTKTPLMNGTL